MKKEKESFTRNVWTLLQSIGIALIVIAVTYFAWPTAKHIGEGNGVRLARLGGSSYGSKSLEPPSVDRSPPTETVIQKRAAELASAVEKKLTYTSLQETDYKEAVFKHSAENKKLSAQYEITVTDAYVSDVYFFESERYTFETGGDLKNKFRVCDEIDKVVNSESKILEAMKQIEINLGLTKGIAEIEINKLQVVLVEMLYTLRRFINLGTDMEILIKGYADGEKSTWGPHDLEKGYDFRDIAVYPAKDPFSKNPFRYIRDEANSFPLKRFPKYGNEDLPNLRAAFFKKDFIDPFLHDSCGGYKNIPVHILDGYEFKNDTGKKEKRKVQLLILLY